MNSVKLYSNGLAVYTREYQLDGTNPTKISIPVKKPDLDEVVASIAVFGQVRLPFPPSYTPVNASATLLQINPASALRDTATKLAGSSVEITKCNNETVIGKLVGMHTTSESGPQGSTVERIKLVVLTEAGLTLVQESELLAVKFTEPATQEEYRKALMASYQTIKPDSSFVDLTLVGEEGAQSAAVTYAIPVAAWKPRYQLRCLQGKWELQSEAVVDNDTDDDWTDSVVSVITGEPISFETDLAEIRRPARSRVNVVSDQAQGAVGVEDTVRRASRKLMRTAAAPAPQAMWGRAEAQAGAIAFDGDSDVVLAESFSYQNQAQGPQAEVRESGDFSIFTSPNSVTIGSKKSAIIPMFRAGLDESKLVLVYNIKNDTRRPFRAIKFKNETKNPLGKGVCEIYLDGDFQGKAILEATSPGQESFLVHAKETGVRVHTDFAAVESRRVGLRIKDGVVTCEQASRTRTTYSLSNRKAEPFAFEIEHARRLSHSQMKLECSSGEAKIAETPSGWRISVQLAGHTGPDTGELDIAVTENSLESQGFGIGHPGGAQWLLQNIIAVKNPLESNPAIQKVIQLQQQVDEFNHQIAEATAQEQTLQSDQERLLKLIPSGHPDQANRWRTELGTNETDLRTLNRKTLPALRASLRDAEKAVQDALHQLAVSWAE